MSRKLGIYVHIPFCASKCGYCDFYSLAGCVRPMPKSLDELVAHIRESAGTPKSYVGDRLDCGRGPRGVQKLDKALRRAENFKTYGGRYGKTDLS